MKSSSYWMLSCRVCCIKQDNDSIFIRWELAARRIDNHSQEALRWSIESR